ncbi:hypothetical protein KCP70_21665 [Salmonella enterica subsp. enterica]|nr:hypothetical protein KCP70_21665 [Salmonella enterica subsp. enterica]
MAHDAFGKMAQRLADMTQASYCGYCFCFARASDARCGSFLKICPAVLAPYDLLLITTFAVLPQNYRNHHDGFAITDLRHGVGSTSYCIGNEVSPRAAYERYHRSAA